MSPELSQLIELQELDLDIQKISDRLSNIPAERDQIEGSFREFASEFLGVKSQYDTILEERRRLEAELAETQEQHDKYKQDLMRVRNEKEYITALREVDATRKQIGVLEGEVLKQMEELEKLEGQIQVYQPDVERRRIEVDQALGELGREAETFEGQIARLNERRKELTRGVPRDVLAMYERVARLRRGQALSEVRDSTCTACSMRIRPKVFSDVRRGDQLITCDNCSRILFYRPNSSEPAEALIS